MLLYLYIVVLCLIVFEGGAMLAKERLNKIYQMILLEESVVVKDLAKHFKVSTMTIRRDLDALESQGVLSKSYGGATLNKGLASEAGFSIKTAQSTVAKAEIGYEVSLFVNEGESIILDCGSTAMQVAKYLPNINITVLTNSWEALTYLSKKPNIKTILAPGVYDNISKGSISVETIDFIRKYHVDKAFISAQGFSIDKGVSVPSSTDAMVKNSLMTQAKTKFLLVDDSKFEVVCMAKFADVKDFDLIIVNNDIKIEHVKVIKAITEVLVASEVK